MLSNVEKEKLVIDLYYNQGKNVREIAQEARMSFRDIGTILKKGQVNHGIITIMDNGNDNNNNSNKSCNEKATQAYKLFSKGTKLSDVAIELGLREKVASKLFSEFLRLKGQQELYEIYQDEKYYLKSLLKLHRLLKREGMTAADNNIEWFFNMVNIGTYNIPDLQKQYAKLQDEVQVIDHQKVVSKAELDNMNNQISILRRTMYQLSATCNSKRNEISYLQAQVQVLRGQINGLNSRNQQQQEIQNESYT